MRCVPEKGQDYCIRNDDQWLIWQSEAKAVHGETAPEGQADVGMMWCSHCWGMVGTNVLPFGCLATQHGVMFRCSEKCTRKWMNKGEGEDLSPHHIDDTENQVWGLGCRCKLVYIYISSFLRHFVFLNGIFVLSSWTIACYASSTSRTNLLVNKTQIVRS